jgi:hypothetical protein
VLSLWETPELCDGTGRDRTKRWVSYLMSRLTHRFVRIAARTVVTSGVSHKVGVELNIRVRRKFEGGMFGKKSVASDLRSDWCRPNCRP